MRPVQRSAIALTTLLLSAASLTAITAPAAVSATPHASSSKAQATTQATTAERDAEISKCATKWRLGAPLGPVKDGLKDGGAHRQYQHGWVIWSPKTGAQVSRGAIRTAYVKAGYEKGKMGYPTTGEYKGTYPDSTTYQEYQGGVMTWHPALGAHTISGAIATRYKTNFNSYGGFNAAQGPEMTGLRNGGAGQRFDGGSIYWSPKTGARAMIGPINAVWINEGKDKGKLGYPTTEGYPAPGPGGVAQTFQNGVIYQNNQKMGILTGAIGQKYFKVGGFTSSVGLPVELKEKTGLVRGGASQSFSKGSIVWSPTNGAFVMQGGIRDAWVKKGAQNGFLGYPITDEVKTKEGVAYQFFEGGTIRWTAKTGAVAYPVPPHSAH
jgi:uncharacterized protein with LGFP repeats